MSEGTSIEPSPIEAEPMLRWFSYQHLPGQQQQASRGFYELAHEITLTIPRGPERTVSLRKLLESKDAAVRAVVVPGA